MKRTHKEFELSRFITVSDNVSASTLRIDVNAVSTSTEGIVYLEIKKSDIERYVSLKKAEVDYDMKKEHLYITVIRNFIRKDNFSELNQALLNEEITEEEFEKKLDEHEDKYVITLNDITQDEDIILIGEMVEKIGYDLKNFSVGDVSEMFSLRENQLISKVNLLPCL